MKQYFLLLVAVHLLLSGYGQQAGNLDLNFAGKGWTPLYYAQGGNVDEETATKILQLPGDKYIAVIYNYSSDYTVLAKYKSDGTRDSSFGTNGFTYPIYLRNAKTAALQNVSGDLKILVAGSADVYEYANFGLTRINSNGTVDTTFGIGGKVSTDFSGNDDYPYAVCIQTISGIDKILLAGRTNDGSGYTDFAMARYNANGGLDATFGTGGKVITDFNGDLDEAHAIFIQADNKIILAGAASRDFAIARYSSNGIPDAAFGSGGKVTTDFYTEADEINAIGIQNVLGVDKIVVAGTCGTPDGIDFAIARYNADGSPDLSFDTVGTVTINFDASNDMIYDLVIDADQKILLAGEATVGFDYDYAFARLKIDGTPDSSFGTNGLQAFKLDHYMAVARSILLDSDSIMVAGGTRDGSYDFSLLRLDAAGALVTSFGTTGEVVGYYSSGQTLSVNAMALQSVNGETKMLFAGKVVKEWGYTDFGLARFNGDGTLDTSFGDKGIVLTDFGYGNDDEAMAVAVQNINGVDKIVVAGTTLDYEYNTPSVAVSRYNANGTPDESFGYLGQATNWGFTATGMAIENDGKIIVAAKPFAYDPAPPTDFAMMRFKTDGTIDAAFGNNGVVVTDFAGYDDVATCVAIQTGGKIILAGKATNAGGTSDFALARYGGTGAPDQGFGTNGKVVLDFNSYDDEATSIAVQADGKIVVGGWETVVNGGSYTNFALARFTSKGKPDLNFGNQGKLTTDFNGYDDAVKSLALQNDGKIIASGYAGKNPASTGYQNDLAVARYDINGVPDTTFGADKSGKLVTDLGFYEEITTSVWKNDRLYTGGNAASIAGFAFPSYFGIAAVYKTSGVSVPYLTINDVTVDEGGTAHLTVDIDQASSSDITIIYITEDVTASGKGKNADYKSGRGSVVITAGQTTADISILTYADNIQEGAETFNVKLALSNQMAALVSMGDNIGVVTINDMPLLVTAKAPTETGIENGTGQLSVRVYPNPGAERFTLQLQSKVTIAATVTIIDASGRIIETRTGVIANSSLQIGSNYRPGIYYAQVVQGSEKVTVKLIKQK